MQEISGMVELLMSKELETVNGGLDLLYTLSEEEPNIVSQVYSYLFSFEWIDGERLSHKELLSLWLTGWLAKSGDSQSLALSKLTLHHVSQLPDTFEHLVGLEELHCSSLTHAPDSLGSFSNLRVLSFEGSKLSHLPSGVTELIKLEELNVSGLGLSDVPSEIGSCVSLRRLDLRGNGL